MNIYRNHHSYPNFHIKDRIINFFRSNSPLNRLIIINVVVYLLIIGIRIVSSLYLFLQGKAVEDSIDRFILEWFGASSNYIIMLVRPWTMITSIFLHVDFFHVFFNMIMLWFSGRIFLYFFSSKKIYTVYLWGGIIGNMLFILLYHLFPAFEFIKNSSVAIGASGGVLAVLIAVATKSPNYLLRLFIIGDIPLKWLALFFVIIDIISIPFGNSGGHFAHLGGALFGFLYVYTPKWKQSLRIPTIKKTKHHQYARPKTDEQYNAERTAYRKKVDDILDKVAKSGYENLTKEEKDFLFQTSNKKNW